MLQRSANKHWVWLVIAIIAIATILIAFAWLNYKPQVKVTVSHRLEQPSHESYYLLRNGSPLEAIKKSVVEAGGNIDSLRWNGGSLIADAAHMGRIDVVRWLLSEGANPDGPIPSQPPLLLAIINRDTEMIELLIEHGANPDLDVGSGLTPRAVAEKSIRDAAITDMLNRAPKESAIDEHVK